MTIGSKIRELRKQKRLTQSELAKKFNISESAISMYERDERDPSLKQLKEFAAYFKVSLDDLLEFGEVYDIGWALKAQRESEGLSLMEVADQVGITTEELEEYESDFMPIDSRIAEEIIHSFGFTFSEFLKEHEIYNDYIPEHFENDVNAYEEFRNAVDLDVENENANTIDLIKLIQDESKTLLLDGKPVDDDFRMKIVQLLSVFK